jgi:hypothetical protein
VTSPNEPGQPVPPGPPEAAGAPGNGNGSHDRAAGDPRTAPAPNRPPGRITDPGDTPPWQRGARAAQQAPPAEQAPPVQPQKRPPESTVHSPGVEARVNRFITGTAAPAVEAAVAAAPVNDPESPPARPDGPRPDGPRPEAYASELPDLSGPIPRPVQQRTAATTRTEGSPQTGPTRTAASSGRLQVSARARGVPVRASMQIRRIDPWSALKVSLLLSVALFFVWMIAVAFLYLVLGGMGVWSKLNSNVGDLLTTTSGSGELVSSGTIFGGAALIGLVNIVLLTAMATIGAFIYNLSTDIVGGVEVTLADRD